MDLNSVELFLRVVEHGSFSAASRQTGVPIATVSRKISDLEQSLNVRLLERSTRKLRLTDAGQTLYEYGARGLDEVNAGILTLQNRESELTGTLRLSIPSNFLPWWNLLSDFQQQYPHIKLDVYTTERNIDFIEDRVDVTTRVGNIDYPSAIGRELVEYQHLLVATPKFIKDYGQPSTPDDLCNFSCAAWCNKGAPVEWVLGGEVVSIAATVRANDFFYIRHVTLQNQHISEQPPFFVNSLMQQGKLVQLLPDYPLPTLKITLLYPGKRQLSRIARVYIDFCVLNAEKYIHYPLPDLALDTPD